MVRCLMLDLISAYENYLTKVKQASANTVFSYLRDVRQFAAWLQEEIGGKAMTVLSQPTEKEIMQAREAGKDASGIVLCTCNAHLIPAQLELLRALAEEGKPMAVVALRNGYDLAYLPEGVCGLAVYEYIRERAGNIARVLRKEMEPIGTLATRLEA